MQLSFSDKYRLLFLGVGLSASAYCFSEHFMLGYKFTSWPFLRFETYSYKGPFPLTKKIGGEQTLPILDNGEQTSR